jgi:hypothetical protein
VLKNNNNNNNKDTVRRCPVSDEKLVETLKPTAHTFSCTKRPRAVDSFQRAVVNVLRSKEKVDAIILTRFDLQFHKKITHLNIDWAKTNIAFPDAEVYWKHSRKVSDLFFVIPIRHARSFLHALEIASKTEEGMAHALYPSLQHMVGVGRINFIIEEGRSSNIDQDDPDPTFLFIDRRCNRFESFCKGAPVQCTQPAPRLPSPPSTS